MEKENLEKKDKVKTRENDIRNAGKNLPDTQNKFDLLKTLSTEIKLDKLLPYKLKDIQVYAFVGPSGSGKSYNAQRVAFENGIETIIDDGLLIKNTQVLAGVSAKKATTKLQTVKDAIFNDSAKQKAVQNAFKKYKIKSVLILGTSDGMVEKIAENLEIGPIKEIIYIKDIVSPEDIELAINVRKGEGKHVIPVPTFEIKKDFSGLLVHPFGKKKKKNALSNPYNTERSIIRPTFSYLGKFTIKDKAIRDIIRIVALHIKGIKKLQKIYIDNNIDTNNMLLSIDIIVAFGCNVNDVCNRFKEKLKQQLEFQTAINIESIEIKVVNIE